MSKYISEKEAATILSEITGREIDETRMKELAIHGVIPAYMEFLPTDRAIYPGKSFSFIAHENEEPTRLNCFETELRTLPFPLRSGDIFKAAEWAFHGLEKLATLRTFDYHVMALRSDGKLEPLGEKHIARLYTVPELRQWKKNVVKYLKTGRHERAIHRCCEAFDGFDIETVGEWRGMSPFSDDPHYSNPDRLPPRSNSATESSTETKRSELVAIFALVKLIITLSEERPGPKLTQDKIIQKIREDLPTAISKSSLEKLFAAANDMRNLLIVEDRQWQAEQSEQIRHLASLNCD